MNPIKGTRKFLHPVQRFRDEASLVRKKSSHSSRALTGRRDFRVEIIFRSAGISSKRFGTNGGCLEDKVCSKNCSPVDGQTSGAFSFANTLKNYRKSQCKPDVTVDFSETEMLRVSEDPSSFAETRLHPMPDINNLIQKFDMHLQHKVPKCKYWSCSRSRRKRLLQLRWRVHVDSASL